MYNNVLLQISEGEMMTHINTEVQSWAFLSLQRGLQISFFLPTEARSSLCLEKEKCSGIIFDPRVLSSHGVSISLRGQFAVFKNSTIHKTE